MPPHGIQNIQVQLRQLSILHSQVVKTLADTLSRLESEFRAIQGIAQVPHSHRRAEESGGGFSVDQRHLSVSYRGKTCFLGNTLRFRLMARLFQSSDQYVSYAELTEEVWHAVRSPATVRSLVKELRNRLRESAMPEVAAAIDGQASGHYCLRLSELFLPVAPKSHG